MNNHIAHALSIWPRYERPTFQMDYKSKTWFIEYDGGIATYHDTLLEALYHCAEQCRTADLSNGRQDAWGPVISYLETVLP